MIDNKTFDKIKKAAQKNEKLEMALSTYDNEVYEAWEADDYGYPDTASDLMKEAERKLLIAASKFGVVKIKFKGVKRKG